jgi:predicted DNA-binding transcriptional regulator YafY
VVSERGSGGGWSLLGDYETKLTGLSGAEIQSLFLARPPRLMADLGLQQTAESALIKLEASLSESARRQAEFARRRILVDTSGWRDASESIGSLPILLDALWRGKQLRFVYRRELCEPAERIAHPLGLVAKGSAWYLVARVDSEPRTYRVSRISEPAALDQPADQADDFDLGAYWRQSAADFREKLPRYYATLLARPSALRWLRYRGWRLESETAEGDLVRVRLRFDAAEEALQCALGLGDSVEVLDPPELRERVLAAAESVVRMYQAGTRAANTTV